MKEPVWRSNWKEGFAVPLFVTGNNGYIDEGHQTKPANAWKIENGKYKAFITEPKMVKGEDHRLFPLQQVRLESPLAIKFKMKLISYDMPKSTWINFLTLADNEELVPTRAITIRPDRSIKYFDFGNSSGVTGDADLDFLLPEDEVEVVCVVDFKNDKRLKMWVNNISVVSVNLRGVVSDELVSFHTGLYASKEISNASMELGEIEIFKLEKVDWSAFPDLP